MRVTAVRKGYFGGKIRDAGEGFDLPDALMGDDKLRPSWVEAAGGVVTARRSRKPKQPSPSVEEETRPDVDENADTSTGNGLIEALGGLPPDWLPGDITE